MTEPQLPTQPDLMLPTLKAADRIGGKGHYTDIDDAAIEIAGITEEQLAIEFPPNSTQKGPKILQRIAWARTLLRRVRALESVSHGVWALTDTGRTFLQLPDEEAHKALQTARHAAYAQREPAQALVSQWKAAAQSGSPHQIPVRTLLTNWGINRRWSSSNKRIQATLTEAGLVTVPDFTVGGIDQIVTIELASSHGSTEPGDIPAESATEPVTLVVGHLASATGGVEAVGPADDLLRAQTIMQINDYSQLAVMKTEHQLKGAVSWESIAKARIQNPDADLSLCMDVEPPVVKGDDPLLDIVPSIVEAGFVFVKGAHNTITGIVTTADLSDQFAGLARPFLLVGEIEQWLRVCLDEAFTPDELLEYLVPDDADREVEGAHSLTLGEIERVLESPSAWDQMGWPADRVAFHQSLDEVRLIRNGIMHFSPDPVADQDLKRLTTFLAYLRLIVPSED
ncbi:MAG: hypothetical protein GY926_12285 [bacterium]|nr:hypothetical protein [bacterium]